MFGLSFLYPAFLAGAVAIAIPIALHLFKRQPEPVVLFSAVRYLKRAPVEHARRRRLREILLLALRACVLGLLAAAFARPYLSGGAAAVAAPITIVAVDVSFSMSAPGQFERARQKAREAIAGAPSTHLVALLAFADRADLVVAPTSARGAALAAVDRLQPGSGATRYHQALARAAEAIGGRRGRVKVVTDLQQTGWESREGAGVPDRIAIEVADVGAPAGNVAVAAVRRGAHGTVAVIRNFGPDASSGRARLTIDGRSDGEVAFTVPPRVAVEAQFAARLPEAGTAAVSIAPPNGYPADDVRYLVLNPPEPSMLLAITVSGQAAVDAYYLERALLAAGATSPFRLRVASAAAFSGNPEAWLQESAAVFLLGTRELDRHGREALGAYVIRGGRMLIAMGEEVDPDLMRGLLGEEVAFGPGPAVSSALPLRFAATDARHPVFRPFGASLGNLGRARFQRIASMSEPERARAIGRFSNGAPALVEFPTGEGRILVFASDLDNRGNDFPRQPTFLPFIHELARYLAVGRAPPRAYLVADVPAGVDPTPGMATVRVAAHGAPRAAIERRIAVNVDIRESDPARITAAAFQAAVTRLNATAAQHARAEAVQQEDQQALWRYGLIAMALVLVAEGLVGRRAA